METYSVLGSVFTVISFAVFVGILLWAFWPSSRAEFEKRARIPLDER